MLIEIRAELRLRAEHGGEKEKGRQHERRMLALSNHCSRGTQKAKLSLLSSCSSLLSTGAREVL